MYISWGLDRLQIGWGLDGLQVNWHGDQLGCGSITGGMGWS